MRAFEFSLQKLLALKESLEKLEEIKLGGALRKLEQHRKKLVDLRAHVDWQAQKMAQLGGKTTDSDELMKHSRYINLLDGKMKKQEEHIDVCRVGVDGIRQKLTTVLREKKSLERLKRREMQDWRIKFVRQERNEMDEVASIRFVHQGAQHEGI